MNLTLALRDLVVSKYVGDDDDTCGDYEGIEALNCWKDPVKTKALVVSYFLII